MLNIGQLIGLSPIKIEKNYDNFVSAINMIVNFYLWKFTSKNDSVIFACPPTECYKVKAAYSEVLSDLSEINWTELNLKTSALGQRRTYTNVPPIIIVLISVQTAIVIDQNWRKKMHLYVK